jgi:hypothetical protein
MEGLDKSDAGQASRLFAPELALSLVGEFKGELRVHFMSKGEADVNGVGSQVGRARHRTGMPLRLEADSTAVQRFTSGGRSARG